MGMSSLRYLNPSTFTDLFSTASLYGGCLWQTQKMNQKNVNEIIGIFVSQFDNILTIHCKNNLEFHYDHALFVKLNYRSLLFRLKAGDYKIEGSILICRIPKEMMGFERRPGGDRFLMPSLLDISVSLKKMERYFGEMTFELELRVIDVSEQGLGVTVTTFNKHIFKLHDRFNIYSIDNKSLKRPITGVICYMNSKGHGLKRGDVRLGLKLNSPLDPETFNYLKKKGQRILYA
jgi:hypothetical protein